MRAEEEIALRFDRGRRIRALALAGLLVLPLAGASADDEQSQEKEAPVVEDGRTVSIEYTLSLEDGTTADSNVGGEPLVYEQGKQQILPALEEALEGMHVDDTKQVTLTPEEGYGKVNPEAFQEVEAENIPEDAREPGTMLVARDSSGNERPVRVHSVEDETVVLDLNHPLAGKILNFDVKVLAIE